MRSKLILLVIVVLLIVMALLSFTRARADTGNATVGPIVPSGPKLNVLPDAVNRYDNFAVRVLASNNTTFRIDVYGANSFHLTFQNTTDPAGLWSGYFNAYYDYGRYTFQLSLGNASIFADLDVGCNAACQSGILLQNGQQQSGQIAAYANFYGAVVILLVIVLVLPGQVSYWRKAARDAQAHGHHTAKDLLIAPFARWRGYIQPGSQVADPNNVQNPRMAADLNRREIMEQLHHATDKKYLEWRPGHIDTLDEIFHDLRYAYDAQKALQPTGAPYAQEYARPAPRPMPPAEKVTLTPKPGRVITDDHTKTGRVVKVAANGGEVGMSDQEMDQYEASLQGERGRDPITALVRHQGRVRRAGYVVAAAGGLLLFMAALVIAAQQGIYVQPLRALWMPWPSDPIKVLLGIGAGGVSLFVGGAVVAFNRKRRASA